MRTGMRNAVVKIWGYSRATIGGSATQFFSLSRRKITENSHVLNAAPKYSNYSQALTIRLWVRQNLN
jgi:hypothetical protein